MIRLSDIYGADLCFWSSEVYTWNLNGISKILETRQHA
jgi:hypothetical protein